MEDKKGFYRYKVFFSVEVTHNYYGNGSCKGLVVRPTFHAQELMKGLLLKLRTTDNGFMVLYDETRLPSLLNYLAANGAWTCLSFILLSDDAYFLNFTELPMDLLDRTLYLSNNDAHLDPAIKGKILLHPGRYEKGGQAERVVSAEMRVTLSREDGKYVLLILDLAGRAVIKKIVETFIRVLAVYIDLSPLPEGKYTLEVWEDGEGMVGRAENFGKKIRSERFIYVAKRAPVLGFFDLFLEDPDAAKKKADFFPVRGDTVTTKHYLVSFENRATRWSYFMVLPGWREGSGLHIKSIDNGYSFDGPREVSIGDGVKAYQFVSRQPIPLKEESPYRFRLLEKKTGGIDEEVMSRLPAAGVSPVLPEGGEMISPLYVNV